MNFLAGAMLGGAVGLLAGLSTSPVVGSIIGGLLALVATFLGLGGEAGPVQGTRSVDRVIGFSAALALALVGGIWLRANQALSPSIADDMARWRAAGFEKEAASLVLYERFGLVPEGYTKDADRDAASEAWRTMAFAQAGDESCSAIMANADAETRLADMTTLGGEWARVAEVIRRAEPASRPALTEAAVRQRCPVAGAESRP